MRFGPSELGRVPGTFSTSAVGQVIRVSSLYFRTELERRKAHKDDVAVQRNEQKPDPVSRSASRAPWLFHDSQGVDNAGDVPEHRQEDVDCRRRGSGSRPGA